jgi:hypothetical protein
LDDKILAIIAIILAILGLGLAASHTTSKISGCNNPPSLEQCGTATVTISAGQSFGSTLVSFSPAFATIPHPLITDCATSSGVCSGNFAQANIKVPGSTLCFICDTSIGQTWVSMPAGLGNEIFGDIHHEVIANLEGFDADSIFAFDCITGSNNVGATLQVQISPDGITWTNFNPIISIDPTSNCGSGTPTEYLFETDPHIQGIAMCSLPNPPCSFLYFRVVGNNGGGVGDNPVFNMMTFQIVPYVVGACLISIGNPSGGGVLSKTSMSIGVLCPAVIAAGLSVKIAWQAQE